MGTNRCLVSLSEVQARPMRWLWPGRLPLGAVSLLEGDPGQGKSLITYDLTARITTGQPMPESKVEPAPAGVVLLQAEDALDATVQPTLSALGADLARVLVYDRSRFVEKPLQFPNDLQLLEDAVRQVKAKLVVIDPFVAFCAGSTAHEQQVRRVLSKLATFAEQMHLSVLLLRHLKKSTSARAMYDGAGSIGLIASVRSGLRTMPDPGSSDPYRHVLVPIKSNVASEAALTYRTCKEGKQLKIEWLGVSPHNCQELVACRTEDSSQLQEAMYLLYQMLKEDAQEAKAVLAQAKDAGISRRTLMRAKQALGVESEKTKYGYWVWLPPKESALLNDLRERERRLAKK